MIGCHDFEMELFGFIYTLGLFIVLGLITAAIYFGGWKIFELYIRGLEKAILFLESEDSMREDAANVAKCIGWTTYILPTLAVGKVLKRDLYQEAVEIVLDGLEDT